MRPLSLLLVACLLAVTFGPALCVADQRIVQKLAPRSSTMSTLALTPAEKEAMKERYGTPADALWARDAPRMGDKKDIEAAQDDFMGYVMGIIPYVAVGIVLFVFVAIFSIFFCCCHCCCHCCEPPAVGYSDKNIRFSLIMAWIFALCVVAGGIGGMVVISTAHKAFTDPDKGLLNIQSIVINNAEELLDEFSGSINAISSQVAPTADNAVTYIGSINGLVAGKMGSLKTQLLDIKAQLDNTTVEFPEYGAKKNCTQCGVAAVQVDGVIAEVDSTTGKNLDDVASFTGDVTDLIVNARDTILDTVAEAFNAIDGVRSNIKSAGNSMNDITESAKTYENIMTNVTYALMALPLLGLVLVIIGTIVKKEGWFKCSWILGFFFCCICWLLAGIFLPIGMVLGDGCVYLDAFEQNPGKLIGEGAQNEKVLMACLLDTSLVTALNMTEDLKFIDIELPTMTMPDAAFDWKEFDKWGALISNFTLADFGLKTSDTDDAIAGLNVLTAPTVFTRNNLDDCDPDNYGANKENVANALKGAKGLLLLENEITIKLDNLNTSFTGVTNFRGDLKTAYGYVLTNTTAISDSVDVLLDNTMHFINTASCGQLGESYGTVKQAFCTDTVKGFSGLGICYFIIGLFGIFYIWFTFRTSIRLQHRSSDVKPDNVDDYFAQLEMQKQQQQLQAAGSPDLEPFPSRPGTGGEGDMQPEEHMVTVSNGGEANLYPRLDDEGKRGMEDAPYDQHLPGQTDESSPNHGVPLDVQDMEQKLAEQRRQLEELQRQQDEQNQLEQQAGFDAQADPLVAPHKSSSEQEL